MRGLIYAGLAPRLTFLLDEARAHPVLAEGCAAGVQRACHVRAELLWKGRGAAQDRDAALSLFSAACDTGFLESCFMVGRVRLIRGALYDAAQAATSFIRACSGRPECQRDAGLRLAAKNELRRAAPLLEAACAGKDSHACEAFGRLLVLLRSRVAEAVPLLERACSGSEQRACRALAHVYAKGLGVRRDPARASRYARLGRDDPDRASRAYRQKLKRGFSPRGTRWEKALALTTLFLPVPMLIFALPSHRRADTGFGFGDLQYADP